MSKRIQRVNQLLKREVSQLLLKEVEPPKDTLITVTRAETTSDLRVSRIFISIIPEENREKIIKFLNRKIYYLQQKINKRLRMKPVPKIIFMEEEKTKTAARIEKILEELKNEKK